MTTHTKERPDGAAAAEKTDKKETMNKGPQLDTPETITRERLIELLNEDLQREYRGDRVRRLLAGDQGR